MVARFALLLLVSLPAAAQTIRFPRAGTAEDGPRGVARVSDADAGEPGSVRLALRGAFFQLDGFPDKGNDRLLSGELTAGWTALRGVEIFGAYRSRSNWNDKASPRLVQAQGDVLLGVKGTVGIGAALAGLDVRLDLRNGLGQDTPVAEASTLHVRALGTLPLKAGRHALRLSVNAGAIIGTSDDALKEAMTPARLFGTGLSGYHRFVAGVSAMVDLGAAAPFLALDLDQPLGLSGRVSAFDVAAKHVSLGVRIPTGSAWGAFDVQADLGLGSGSAGFAKTPPYLITIAYALAFDPGLYSLPPPPPPAPTTGRIAGRVVDLADGRPLAGAVVSADGAPPVATDAQGAFATHELAAGPVTLRVARSGYKDAAVEARVAAGHDAPADVHLEAVPPPPPPPPPPVPPPPPPMGFLAGRIDGLEPGAVADVRLSGPATKTARTEAGGLFSEKLSPGTWHVVALPAGHAARTAIVAISADKATPLVLRTTPLRSPPGYVLEGAKVVLTVPLKLDEKSPLPGAADAASLDELADLAVRNPGKTLHIDVYSESMSRRGQGQDRQTWTQERADALRHALVDRDVPEDQVTATGHGAANAIYPSIGRERLKNRRVEVRLEDRPAAKPAVAPVPGWTPKAAAATPDGADLTELPPIQ